jgi:hypothetical protein
MTSSIKLGRLPDAVFATRMPRADAILESEADAPQPVHSCGRPRFVDAPSGRRSKLIKIPNSNRYTLRVESPVSHRKQTTGTNSNRYTKRGSPAYSHALGLVQCGLQSAGQNLYPCHLTAYKPAADYGNVNSLNGDPLCGKFGHSLRKHRGVGDS